MRKAALLALLLTTAAAQAQNPPQPGFYFDTQVLWFDSPITDFHNGSNAADESGQIELAPRFILGYDGDGIGARVRWWTFDRTARIYSPAILEADTTLTVDVVDLEATTHIRGETSDFLLSGGARIAAFGIDEHLVIQDVTTFEKAVLGGVTLGGEGRTSIFANDLWGTAFIYGGRLSLLQGDWEGDRPYTPFVDTELNLQNERFIVPEVFTGIEAHYGRAFTRLTVELQQWEGKEYDTYGGIVGHNFGFTGFGFDMGYSF